MDLQQRPWATSAVDSSHGNGFTATDGVCAAASFVGGTYVRYGVYMVALFSGATCTVGADTSVCDVVVVGELSPSGTALPLSAFTFRGVYAVAG